MSRFLSDVDGCIGDLMGRDGGGFTLWCKERGIDFDPNALGNLRVTGEGRQLLLQFLREPDAYLRYVNPIAGAQEYLARLAAMRLPNGQPKHAIRFVTSITEEPLQYAAKDAWLKKHFGHFEFETLTIPSREKHYHIGDFMVDDRADTIARFLTVGDRRGVFLFRQPWNFAYGDEGGYWRDPVAFANVANTLNAAHDCRGPDSDLWLPPPFVSHTDVWEEIVLAVERSSG